MHKSIYQWYQNYSRFCSDKCHAFEVNIGGENRGLRERYGYFFLIYGFPGIRGCKLGSLKTLGEGKSLVRFSVYGTFHITVVEEFQCHQIYQRCQRF